MRVEQVSWSEEAGWSTRPALADASVVLAFGSPSALKGAQLQELRGFYPKACIVGCSTAGEIAGTRVLDDSLVATAALFREAHAELAQASLREGQSDEELGGQIARSLPHAGLVHVLLFCDGLGINGSALVSGMMAALPPGVHITGGLAGDGARFRDTFVVADGRVLGRAIAALGLYGPRLRVGFGSLGGWDAFGPLRLVTSSKGNVLFELDGQPALALYMKYLGEHAAGLPATGLLFPLNVTAPGRPSLTRTILAVDEGAQSMTFAGDIPTGAHAQLMKANFDRLVDGAQGAAQQSARLSDGVAPELAILISCVGRKLVLRQRTEEELEAVQDVLGAGVAMAGFYSYGEICPASPNADCELHNQTMTITTLREA